MDLRILGIKCYHYTMILKCIRKEFPCWLLLLSIGLHQFNKFTLCKLLHELSIASVNDYGV